MSGTRKILVCQCAERGLVNVDEASGLVAQDPLAIIPDLCKAAAARDPVLGSGFAEIHACHPRAVRALFAFAGFPLSGAVTIHNHRTPAPACPPLSPSTGEAPAWFPVIDAGRCSGCGQCLGFCLFGVYEKDAQGRVAVAHPENCKDNCPACARICPETAIVFPKCAEAPINGADVPSEAARKAAVRINVDEILGSDAYAALRARKQRRRALLNAEKIERALAERERCAEAE